MKLLYKKLQAYKLIQHLIRQFKVPGSKKENKINPEIPLEHGI